LFDLKNCTIAKFYDDNSFDIIIEKDNFINSKHRQGGQSSQRFERERENQIKHWFKKVRELYTNLDTDNVIVGCNSIYEKRINLRPKKFITCEYFDESGVWQYKNSL